VVLRFAVNADVKNSRWEFRTDWSGEGELVIESITLALAGHSG
jgi:hypothetical protein